MSIFVGCSFLTHIRVVDNEEITLASARVRSEVIPQLAQRLDAFETLFVNRCAYGLLHTLYTMSVVVHAQRIIH